MGRRSTAIVVAWLLVPAPGLGAGTGHAAEQLRAHFQRVGSEVGPPAEVVTAVLQDRVGFVWIGSRDGLSRYDGEKFSGFRHDPGDPTSISDHSIRTIFEDRSGTLWIGTNTAGLNLFDQATGRFEHFRHDADDSTTLSHDSVYAIAEDASGNLWVGTQKGLNRFDRSTGAFERFFADPDDPLSLSSDYVTCILIDRADRLWIGTNRGGLNLFDPTKGGFEPVRDEDGPSPLADESVFALFEDKEGYLWIGGSGLRRLDPATGSLARFDTDARLPLTDSLIVALASGAAETLWVGTFGGGLIELDTASGATRVFQHQQLERNSLGDNRVLALATDSGGALWIGTWGGGLWRLTPSSLQLATAAADLLPPEGLTDNDVTALARDAAGGLWVGTRNGFLLRGGPDGREFRQYMSQYDTILDIQETDDGMVWIGRSTNLTRLNTATGTLTIFRHDPSDRYSIGPGYVTALLEDNQSRLWVGTGEGGLQRLDGDGRVVDRFVSVPGDPTSLSDNYVTSLAQDDEGTIWIGTRSGGLNSYDPAARRGRRFVPSVDDPSAISHHYVTAIFEDHRRRLWVGTGGGGLNLVRRGADQSVTFERISRADGLIDDNVMAILEDDDGSLWLSTTRGLSRFDPEEHRFSRLFVEDGLSAAAFEPGAAVRTETTLIFGSIRWLADLPAGTPFPRQPPSPVVITSIRDRSGELVGEAPAWQRDHLEMPFGDWLSVTLAVLDFNAEHNHAFRFRLGDAGQAWVDLGSNHEITFTDLDPGSHQFSAQGQNCQGVWNEISPQLTIEVLPPFWMTIWFRAGLFLAILGVIFGVHHLRTSALKRHNLKLVELHKQRKRAQSELTHAYERLRSLTRRLVKAKEEERHRIARELHDEMGPALTAVIINLQLIKGTRDREKLGRWTTDSIDTVDRMVQQVRDLSLALRPPLLDEVGFLPAVRAYLETQAERTGLMIRIEAPETIEASAPEIEITAFRVIQEAVSNVIRHARAANISVTITPQSHRLELSVQDDGIGFDTQATMVSSAPGAALGLFGMQERVQALGGSFEIASRPGEGTTVRAGLPMEVES